MPAAPGNNLIDFEKADQNDNVRTFYRSHITIPTSMTSMFMLVNEKLTATQQRKYYEDFDVLVLHMQRCRSAFKTASVELQQEFLIEHRIYRERLYRLAFQHDAKAALSTDNGDL